MSGSGQRSLVVDDEPMLRLLLGDLLRDEGYTVVEAADGAEAIRHLNEHRPPPHRLGLVLLDMMMPRVNGLGVLKHLATLDSYVPVVAMSANAGRLTEAQRAGAKETVAKPFDLDHLLAVVDHNCGRW